MILANTMSNSDDNIKRIINLMQTDDSVDAPSDAVKWSKNIFRSQIAVPKMSVVEKVLGVLRIDISPNKAVFGERSGSASQTRQMLFEAGEHSIDLRVSKTEDGITVKGQILGGGFENAFVQMGKKDTTTNDLSEFTIPEMTKGRYLLRVRSFEKEIVIEDIEIH